MSEIIDRLKAKSPVFFKKVKKVAFYVGGSAASVIAVNGSMVLNLNHTLISICGYVVAVCVAIAGTAQLTKEDNPNQ